MSKIKFISAFFVLFVLSSFAVKAQPSTQVGGLFYSPQTQESFYVEWDAKNHNVAKIFWAKGNQAYKQFEIISQTNKSEEALFNVLEHFITISEKGNANVSYELNLFAVKAVDYTTIHLTTKGSDEKTVFMQIAMAGRFVFDAKKSKPNELIADALSSLSWEAFDAETREMDMNSIAVVKPTQTADNFMIIITQNEEKLIFIAKINSDLSITCATYNSKEFSMKAKLEIMNHKQWKISIYDSSGELIKTILHNISPN